MNIDIKTFRRIENCRIEAGAILGLSEYVTSKYKFSNNDSRDFVNSVFDTLWSFVESKSILFDDVYARYNERVTIIYEDMMETEIDQHFYMVFSSCFYYCLWIINAANWRAGMNPGSSEEIAEMKPSVLLEITEHAVKTGSVSQWNVEEYFKRIVLELCNTSITVARSTFDKYMMILSQTPSVSTRSA